MLEQVRRAVVRHRMLAPGELVLVAVSGGPDSVALARALDLLIPEFGVRLHLFHLNHGLRGAAGSADARWVEEFARRLRHPCTVREVDVAAEARVHGGVEAAGRAVRYRELGRLAAELGARRIAVGHNREDQAETLLLRLLRGAGRRGLGGMAPVRPAGPPAPPGTTLIRPLLGVSRADIEAFCRAESLEPRLDETNAESLYQRNRIRLELLPFLRERFNPQIALRLAETAAVLRDEDEFLDEATRLACLRLGMSPDHVPVGPLLQEHRALQRRMIRLVAEQAGLTLDLGHVEAILDLARMPGTATLSLPGGWQAMAAYGHVRLRAPGEQAPVAALPEPVPLPVPGSVTALGWRFTASIGGAGPGSGQGASLALNPASLPGGLAVRTWRPGDRLYLPGMAGSKKLQDLFVDLKIPRDERRRVPLLVSGDAVLWVVGVRADRRFLAAPGTDPIWVTAMPGAAAGEPDPAARRSLD